MYAGPPAKKALCAANSSKNPATIVGVALVRRPSTINCSARRLAGESTAERRPPGASSDPPAAPPISRKSQVSPSYRPPGTRSRRWPAPRRRPPATWRHRGDPVGSVVEKAGVGRRRNGDVAAAVPGGRERRGDEPGLARVDERGRVQEPAGRRELADEVHIQEEQVASLRPPAQQALQRVVRRATARDVDEAEVQAPGSVLLVEARDRSRRRLGASAHGHRALRPPRPGRG